MTMTTTEQRIAGWARQQYAELMAANPNAHCCPLCDGLGWFSVEAPIDHILFGKAMRCPCRDNWKGPASDSHAAERALSKLFGETGIPPSHQNFTLASFEAMPQDVRQSKRRALLACKQLARFGSITLKKSGLIKCGIVLAGDPGLGKTALACAFGIEVGAMGKPVLFRDYNDSINNIQATYNRDYRGPSKQQLIDALSNAPILILDDMGDFEDDDPIKSDKRDRTYDIIRPRHAKKLVTVLTTNLNRERFKKKFGGRVNRRVREDYLWIDVGEGDLTQYGEA